MPHKRKPTDVIPNLKNYTVGDFWSWAYSDILSNASRGVYAEFLVGTALEVVDKVRYEWDDFDLIYDGCKIEIKSAAYLQTWEQKRDSIISFGIAPKTTGTRSADIYVFCLFVSKDPLTANVLDPIQWEFYIVPTHLLPLTKSIGYNPLVKLCKDANLSFPTTYDSLKAQIDLIITTLKGDTTNRPGADF